MEPDILTKFLQMIAALGVVVALMGALALLLRKAGEGSLRHITPKSKRLYIMESLYLDARRRLVLIRRDNTEHLVILGANGETVVETGITREEITPDEACSDINSDSKVPNG